MKKLFSSAFGYMKANPHLWLSLYAPLQVAVFFIVEYMVPETADYWVSYSRLDDFIPFLEIFVIPYCLWYFYLVGTGLALHLKRDIEGFKNYIFALALGFNLTLLFCIIFPNGQNLRPEVFPRDNIFSAMVGVLYAIDTSTNVFPSMHVMGAVTGLFAVYCSKPLKKLRHLWTVVAVLIILSTVFIKQHSVIDIYGGIAVCIPAFFIFYFRKGRKSEG